MLWYSTRRQFDNFVNMSVKEYSLAVRSGVVGTKCVLQNSSQSAQNEKWKNFRIYICLNVYMVRVINAQMINFHENAGPARSGKWQLRHLAQESFMLASGYWAVLIVEPLNKGFWLGHQVKSSTECM